MGNSRIASGAVALLAAVLTMVSCQQVVTSNTETKTTNNNTTTKTYKVMIDLPASLTPATTPTAEGTAPDAAFRALSAAKAGPSSYTSAGYGTLYTAVEQARSFSQSMAVSSVMYDALITQNNLTPSADVHTGLTINITGEMVDQMKAALPAGLVDADSIPGAGSIPVPDFVYSDSDNDKFDYQLTTAQEGMDQAIYWTKDWSRSAIKATMTGPMSMVVTIANDTATKSVFMDISGGGITYRLKFKADPGSSNHGVFVSLAMGMKFIVGDGDAAFELNLNSLATGYGDDIGGTVLFDSESFLGTTNYTENFNAAGQVTYQAFTVEGAETPTVTVGEADSTYDGKLENTDWGDASTFFAEPAS